MSREEISREFEIMRERVREQTEKAQRAYKEQYDEKSVEREFGVNERVWVKNREFSNAGEDIAQKLTPKYLPGVVIGRLGTQTYDICLDNGRHLAKIHANDLLKN